ncbi:diaminopimelate epimerase [Actinosynnema sp. NPDC047251]|uniref:Diaminopimelate epimerase n=1 Tax=Saccharothrix espanaensis (strain ATCC 51144 / DSM 44229 / JCM 9112 / NBRC 15066 / NRRL 15764) TaxID=1179773 RepID=K0JXT1_SACES|nr:diaminopimelate epimerase [Saccharothrix espanaensis]CCH29023.1 Diaminopimelate epimerase [Saccharothrix espanaensis DSM 44229]
MGVEFLKGHGTENDFVLLPDPDGLLDLTESRVRALCDRQRGLGADGVLRVVRPDFGPWFMDYRNADGSIAEMCGNGVRVFARYLVEAGLVPLGEFAVGTRAGQRGITAHEDGTVTADMGPARVTGTSSARVGGVEFAGVAVNVGNPHLACLTETPVASLDLRDQPAHDPAVFPQGVNVEFVNVLGDGALRMRVHERGVGETRSCGTGTVATVAAWLHSTGQRTGKATVDVLGGQVTVVVEEESSTLTGPAVLLARGELDQAWWDAL